MTDQQINEAIHTHLGWTVIRRDADGWPTGWMGRDGACQLICLDYCNDLNAMHEAEKTLYVGINDQRYWQAGYGGFQTRLSVICDKPFSATARERAEAFLKTVGGWSNTTEGRQ